MEALTEGLVVSDVDTVMTAIIAEDTTDQQPDDCDEVEDLRNSLRQAIHDDSVQPKMQCLMMDSSFSMVTMQGEDSGIAWETTPSHFTTPWASQAEKSSELIPPVATSGPVPAGKIIFVMDEELFSRRKKSKEKMNGQKSNSNRHREVFTQSSEDISGRPELVGVSQPNVKTEEGDEQEPNDLSINKEQRLFRLVSEGSEILNIVVPPKLYTVDEEESKEMVDNLSYLEESPVSKIREETNDYELVVSTTGLGAAGADQVKPPPSGVMDPPGAPVARPLGSTAACNVDYFEAYSLIDVQAPGSPAVVALGQVEQELRVYTDSQDTKKPVQSRENTTMATTRVDKDKSDAISIGEINCELLDDVFYGGTESYKKIVNENGVSETTPNRVPLKPTGSTLFGSQEDILTPIFLPDGPPKIIDPMLLEEPKAMAFLYTDLYEEAVGSREKEADAESVTSEKSFHSRNSDREARGYLEKYVLIDETPVMEHTDKQRFPEETSWILSQDLYEFGDFISKPEKNEIPSSEDEITDFFRSSANSSPCDKEPFAQSLKKDEAEPTKTKDKTNKSVSIKVEKVIETPVDQLSISTFEFPLEETDCGSTDDYKLNENYGHIDFWKQDTEVQKPVAPPRRKERSCSKTCLDLTPLIPIDLTQEKEETGENEQKEEEKEMPFLAETTVKEDGGGQQTMQTSYNVAAEESVQDESVKDDNEITIKPSADEAKDARTVEMSENEAAIKQTESGEADTKSSTSAETESYPEKQIDSLTLSSTEPAKDKGQCAIL